MRGARVAVVSDIHANLHALEAVLAEVERERVDELWCLGDVVGYGPRPAECCELVRERADLCLAGNHDLAVLGLLDLGDFTPDAAAAARWTRGRLSENARAFLGSLEPRGERAGVELFHGSARDPVWEYVVSAEAAEATFALTAAPVVLVGHSHLALVLSLDETGEPTGGPAVAGTQLDLGPERFLLNPGSVGQPRDGDPRASWLLLDLDRMFAGFLRVPYSVGCTQTELREAGLPELLAARLEHGN